jgi:KilA-N domain
LNTIESRRSHLSGGSDFYEVTGDNKDELVAKTTGQYVRKELILDIASWVSVEFYDKCNRVIVDFYVAEYKRQQENNKAERCRDKDVLDKNDELLERNETIETRVVSIQTKLDVAVEDRAPQPIEWKRENISSCSRETTTTIRSQTTRTTVRRNDRLARRAPKL